MTDDKQFQALREYEKGVSVHELAQDYGVAPRTVRGWLADARRRRALQMEYDEMLGLRQNG